MKKHPALRALFDSVRRMKALTFLLLLLVAGAVGASLLPPLALEKAVNLLAGGQAVPLSLAFGYLGLLALANVLEAGREGLLTLFGQKMTHALRRTLCSKLSRLPAAYFAGQEPGNTVSRFVGDVDTLENLFTSGMIGMLADGCKVVSILAVLFVKNKGLALLLLLLLPPLFLFTRRVQRKMLAAQKQNRAAVGRAADFVPETIRASRTIRALCKTGYMKKKYNGVIDESYAAVEKTNFYDAIYSPVILLVNACVVAAVMLLFAGGGSTFFGMSVGTAVAVIAYIAQVFAPLESIGMEIQTIQSAMAGLGRIEAFLCLPERWPTDGEITQTSPVPVQVDNVTFGYGEESVLNGMSLMVQKGEQAVLVGRTGAGKSTLFKLLLGLYKPEKGHVYLYGQEAALVPEGKRRGLVGYVEQTFHRVPGTVMEQITLSDKAITRDMAMRAAETVGISEAILHLPDGYETLCTPGLFSQGQWQLLSIARAIAAEPELLLLDEITANLDAETEKHVLTALNKASRNRTILSISHRLYGQENMRQINI